MKSSCTSHKMQKRRLAAEFGLEFGGAGVWGSKESKQEQSQLIIAQLIYTHTAQPVGVSNKMFKHMGSLL